jgi:glycosyltransferase involved in cell wall biosynthesis
MDVWLRAAALVRRQIDAHFIVGGEGSERRSLERLTKQLGLDQSVSFIGYLSDLDYPRLYSVADVFAITSPAELQSIVSLEALASSLPIVAARAGALPELVRAGENGYLVRPGDPSSLADALVRILGDAERRTAMGVVSREVAGAHDFEHTLDVYEQVYHSVIAQPSPIPFVRSGDLERAASA